jgi:ubiquitin-protein ligase
MSLDMDSYIKELRVLLAKASNGSTGENKDSKVVRLIKHNENVSDVTLHFDVESFPVKVTTDFNKYCFAESVLDTINLNHFNLGILFKKKNPKTILDEINKILYNESKQKTKTTYSDPFHIYQKIDEFSKYLIDYPKLEKSFSKVLEASKASGLGDKIPKELLLSPVQITQLIINEIKKVNRNKDYTHYIVPDESNPYSLQIRIKFNPETEVGKIFQQINKSFGYDYMEMKLSVDPKAHPYIPPKLEYVKPKIKLPLLLSLMNLEILKLENWSPMMTLDYFMSQLGVQLESVVKDYVIPDAPTNANATISFNDLEYQLIKLASITKESSLDQVKLNISVPKPVGGSSTNTKYWKSGYGNDELRQWDIKNYIKEQELQKDELTKCLHSINSMIDDSNIETIRESVLMKYVITQVQGLNMLELEKNRGLYLKIFNILSNLVGKQVNKGFVNEIGTGLKTIYDEIDMFFKSSSESLKDEHLLQIWCLSDYYLSKYQEPAKQIVIPTDIKEQYCQIMKKLQFGTYEIPGSHRFGKYKGTKPEQKALMRILSEISSFKTGLPLNWESTIWVRVPKDNFNIFSFLISGPKDTPYENGLFEFHAYLPPDYPNTVPQVLIHTTGGGRVRFNPNLYDSGKVCLSLLGTWSGQEGEKWNPKTSTFLQVMISIQSLILVEQPYFNEPGYERDINNSTGKSRSNSYNEERQPHTISLAMTDMIRNPPTGFEDVVRNHFRMKKEEIINNTLIWQQNASYHKALIEKNRNELIGLLNTL